MISYTEIKYFVEIAYSLNISRASERLGITQPSLSVAIKKIEKEIGTRLLIRTKKGVLLTQAGKQFLLHAKHLLREWKDIKTKTL